MARIAAGPPAGFERDYVPEALGNREAPPADVVRVRLRSMTEGEKRACSRVLEAPAAAPGSDPVCTKASLLAWKREALLLGVVSVSNYQRRGAGGEAIPIATARDFVEHAERELWVEVADELITGFALSEAQKKLRLVARLVERDEPALGWDCGECERTGQRELRGHYGEQPHTVAVGRDGTRWRRCPKAWLTDEAGSEGELYGDARRYLARSIMPAAGGSARPGSEVC